MCRFINEEMNPQLGGSATDECVGVDDSYMNSSEFSVGIKSWQQVCPLCITLTEKLVDTLPDGWSVILSSFDPMFGDMPLFWCIFDKTLVRAYAEDPRVFEEFGVAQE